MKVYLSGPMTDIDNFNIPAFEECATVIRNMIKTGELLCPFTEVLVPHEITKDIMSVDLEWKDYMKADIRAMLDCDAIMMLEGWQKSKGARLELHLALELGMKIFIYDRHNQGWS